MTIIGLDHAINPTPNPAALMEFYGALGFDIPDERFWRKVPEPRLATDANLVEFIVYEVL